MPQLFKPVSDTIVRTVLVAALVIPILFVGFAYAVTASPFVTGQKIVITQPVPFSHEHHSRQLGIDCRYCHTSVEKAANAGFPPTETCMTCHSQLWTNAAMLAPVRESFADDKPIAWQKVHRLPDYVYFDHSIHVTKGVGCTECHGPVGTMPLMYQNAPLTMQWCIECHRNPAPHLRSKADIFSLDWEPPADQTERGHALLVEYGIKPDHLTDCSVCHR